MTGHSGKALSWKIAGGVIEVTLHREPCNEIGTLFLSELEQLVSALPGLEESAHAFIIHSTLGCGFSAGGDLRELYEGIKTTEQSAALAGIRDFHQRIHNVMNTLDSTPLTTIAAAHGIVFGGGLELALTGDMIIADKTARFCFPELRLELFLGSGEFRD